MYKLGSLCTGYGGLDAGVAAALGGADTLWVADNDPGCQKILAYRMPGVPNLGDIKTVAWEDVPAVDVLCAGFPCQPVSAAGKQKGMDDERWLWPSIADAIGRMGTRPGLLVFENVPRLRTISNGAALEQVIYSLAALGYVGRYGLYRASDWAGAPHRRERFFILATHTSASGGWGRQLPGAELDGHEAVGRQAGAQLGHRGEPLADAECDGLQGSRPATGTDTGWQGAPSFGRRLAHRGEPLADAERAGFQGPAGVGRRRRQPAERGAEPVALLPTPAATLGSNGGLVTEAKGREGGTLIETISLLKTPTAQLATNGGSQHPDKRRAGGHGPTLDDQVSWELLPTPRATRGGSGTETMYLLGGQRDDTNRPQGEVLLPTPMATMQTKSTRALTASTDNGRRSGGGQSSPLGLGEITQLMAGIRPAHLPPDDQLPPASRDIVNDLLPTPSVAMAEGGQRGRSGDRKGELLLGGLAQQFDLLPTPRTADGLNEHMEVTQARLDRGTRWRGTIEEAVAQSTRSVLVDWGKYERAIRRWERIFGYPAPCPVEPGKNGNRRLAPAFAEWMMGLPPGWVTGVPGLSRIEHLRAIGNGVVPQQAYAAVADMLSSMDKQG